MEEVQFSEYHGRDRQTTRFLYSENEREEMGFLPRAAIGIAAAAGVLAVGHRTGAIRRIARFLDTEGKATIQAAREVMDQQGNVLFGTDKLTFDRLRVLRDSFVERRRENLNLLNTAPQEILLSREMDVERYLRQRSRLIGEVKEPGNYTGEVPYHIQEGLRFSAIMEEVRQTNMLTEDAMVELERALIKGRVGFLNHADDDVIRTVLRDHGEGVGSDEVWELLKEARDKYKGKDFIAESPEAMRLVQGMQERLRELTATQMDDITKKDGFLTHARIGHKQATVGDILALEEAGKIRMDADLRAQIDDVLKYNKEFTDTVFDENLYLSVSNGELIDYKVFSDIRSRTAEWWANTIPGGLLHLRNFLNIKQAREQASFYIFERGTIQSSLNAHRGFEITEALTEEVVFVNGKFVKLFDYDAVREGGPLNILNPDRDMYLTSARFGSISKMHRQMTGIMTDNETPRNIFSTIFDLGRQDNDNLLTQSVSVFTKFFRGDWQRNKVRNMINHGISTPQEFYELNKYFQLNAGDLTPRLLNQLKDRLPRQLQTFIERENINFSRDEDMLKLFRHIGEAETRHQGHLDFHSGTRPTGPRRSSPHTDLIALYRQFDRNPDQILNRKTPVGESNPILGHHTRIQTGMDEINQQTSLYILQEIINKEMNQTSSETAISISNQMRQLFKNMHAEGTILSGDLREAENLLNYTMFRSQGFDIKNNQTAALNRVSELLKHNEEFQESLRIMSTKTNPIWERFSDARPINQINDEFLAVNESNIGGIFNQMFGIHSTTRERVTALKDLATQLSPFTGRRNMEDVTTLSMFSSYYPVYRLQDALGHVGLGLSDQSMANAYQMMSALMWKRIFPVYGAVEGYKYADWKIDQWTGEGLDERWENYKAQERLRRAEGRTELDLYEAQRRRSLRPGIEHWEAMPSFYIPGFGEFGMGNVLNTIATPIFGSAPLREEELMSYEETLDDLYEGVEEIRKSRWWFAGSKSAYRGDRIIEFAPNSFRRAHSDYEWTNTSATGEEYWGNHILPTFENPLGLLSFAIGTRDPYWYERKHYYDRPYMLTGELFNPNTMILGDIGNATIGRLIKPVQEMHPEYWGDPVLIYDEEVAPTGNRPTGPVRTQISPGGRMTHDVLATPADYGGVESGAYYTGDGEPITVMNPDMLTRPTEADYVMSPELDETGATTGGYVATHVPTGRTVYVPSNVSDELTIQEAFEQAEADGPYGSEVGAVTVSTQNPSYQAQISTQPRAMMDPEYAYKQDVFYRKLINMRDPRDGSWRLQEGIENWTEPLGVYKWIIGDELLGRDPYAGEMVIQRADAAYNASNRFWESELGSLGSQLSEIGRRFIRRDSGQLDFYNPIRNTMADWLPGDNYFINFQTGDPYSKIPNGERRLPGEAYESLHELHSDEFGRYGAFDRFKILADVAPWSDEYKFWNQYVMENIHDPELRKEATQIRRQVAQVRQRFDFQPYRFKGNDIVEQEVTVSRFLDDYTFLTEEFGDTPIRVAGMEYRRKAEGVLEQYFQVGDQVTIGVAEDETQRISRDTYGTMRAVIFTELGNINQRIIERGEMVENMNDFSAPGVHARFTPREIAQGRRWETVAHTSSPLNTKFLQVRTALEEYERDQIYGKDWATWENFLYDDYIKPTLEGLGRFDNPLWSGVAGATTGLVIGRFFLKGGRPTKIAAVTGALYGLGSNAYFKNYEREHGEAWIPERRRMEHDINEYFDILTYLKNEGLYQRAREEIIHTTGIDVEDFARLIEEQKALNKETRKELEEERKWLYLNQPDGWEERRTEINKQLETISDDWDSLYLPDPFLRALQYREERDTTLYGVDPYGDRMKTMQAFPYKDKWFFNEFANANQEERERILQLVPENQRRIYKAIWGMGLEERKPLEYYMEKYNIPDWTWEGWRPEYDLEDIKTKVVMEVGLDLSDFNIWTDDVEASQYVPDLHTDGNQYQGEAISNFQGYRQLRQNIINILQGQGLQDVSVIVTPSYGSESNVNIIYTEDRRDEIKEHLRLYGDRYL